MMDRCGEEIGVNLAGSLHAVTKEVRDEIVPLNKKYGIEELLSACKVHLPAFMLPSRVECREGSLPRNPNGKIDRKLLAQEFQNTFMEPAHE